MKFEEPVIEPVDEVCLDVYLPDDSPYRYAFPLKTFTLKLQKLANPLLAGVVFAGIFAAVMSTADSFLNVGTAAIVHDLPKAFRGRPLRSERRPNRTAPKASPPMNTASTAT